MKSDHFLTKAAFSHPNIAPAKKTEQKIIVVNYLKKKFKALNRLKTKSKFHVVPFQKQKQNVFPIQTKTYSGVKNPFGGESSPGLQRDKLGYSPLCTVPSISAKLVSYEILKLQNDTVELDQRSGTLLYTAT